MSVCRVCSYRCVCEVCVQILVRPLVQCTYIGPTVHNHYLFLCFKSIYFLILPPTPTPPPPCLQRQDSSVWHAKRSSSQTAAGRRSLIHLAAVSERTAKDYSATMLLISLAAAARIDRHSALIRGTRDIFWWSDVRTTKIPFSEPTGPVDAY